MLNRLSRVFSCACVCVCVSEWTEQMVISDVCLSCRSPRTAATPQSKMRMLKVGFIFSHTLLFSSGWSEGLLGVCL